MGEENVAAVGGDGGVGGGRIEEPALGRALIYRQPGQARLVEDRARVVAQDEAEEFGIVGRPLVGALGLGVEGHLARLGTLGDVGYEHVPAAVAVGLEGEAAAIVRDQRPGIAARGVLDDLGHAALGGRQPDGVAPLKEEVLAVGQKRGARGEVDALGVEALREGDGGRAAGPLRNLGLRGLGLGGAQGTREHGQGAE